MSYASDTLEKEAARTSDTRTAKLIKALLPSLRKQPAPWEVDLIARLTAVAQEIWFNPASRAEIIYITSRGVTLADIVTVVGAESGGYWDTYNLNDDGTADVGVVQWNAVHGYADADRLNPIKSLALMVDMVADNMANDRPPFKGWNAARYPNKTWWQPGMTPTEGMAKVRPYAIRASVIALSSHPTKSYPVKGTS